jgi:hypothetical protein
MFEAFVHALCHNRPAIVCTVQGRLVVDKKGNSHIERAIIEAGWDRR